MPAGRGRLRAGVTVRPPARTGRIAAALGLLLLLPGCLDLPEESKDLIRVFVVVLAVNCVLQAILILAILLYFLPFTRPTRRRRRRR